MNPLRLIDWIFPNVCEVCHRTLLEGEDVMCLHCQHQLPRTGCHNSQFNIVHQRLASTVPIARAAGYFHYYRESEYVKIIHRAKYSGRPELLRHLSARYAREIASDGFFDGIDLIIPIPLHRWKLIKRGYNQSDYIARGISEVTGIARADNLVARRSHSSQTARGAFSRWLNAQNVYSVVRSQELSSRHLLVVDDVITTGATLLAACNALHSAVPDATLSVLALGVTHLD